MQQKTGKGYEIHTIEEFGTNGSMLAQMIDCVHHVRDDGNGLHLPASRIKDVFLYHKNLDMQFGYVVNHSSDMTGNVSNHGHKFVIILITNFYLGAKLEGIEGSRNRPWIGSFSLTASNMEKKEWKRTSLYLWGWVVETVSTLHGWQFRGNSGMQITQYSRISICNDVWYVSSQPIPTIK